MADLIAEVFAIHYFKDGRWYYQPWSQPLIEKLHLSYDAPFDGDNLFDLAVSAGESMHVLSLLVECAV